MSTEIPAARSAGHYVWRPAEGSWDNGATLVTDAADGAVVRFHLDPRDGDPRPSFVVELPERAGFLDTDKAADWPAIEKYVPRDEWPEPMFVGQRGPVVRRPDPAVAEAVAECRRGMIRDAVAAIQEDEAVRLALRWQGPAFNVVPEEWDETLEWTVTLMVEDPEGSEEWVALSDVVGGPVEDTVSFGPADGDPADSEPYDEAEDRLLARFDLGRDRVAETIQPW